MSHPYADEITALEHRIHEVVKEETDFSIATSPEIAEIIRKLSIDAVDKLHGTEETDEGSEVLYPDMDIFHGED